MLHSAIISFILDSSATRSLYITIDFFMQLCFTDIWLSCISQNRSASVLISTDVFHSIPSCLIENLVPCLNKLYCSDCARTQGLTNRWPIINTVPECILCWHRQKPEAADASKKLNAVVNKFQNLLWYICCQEKVFHLFKVWGYVLN